MTWILIHNNDCRIVSNNDLVMLNRNKELCTGTFTRITPTTSSILDYAIVTKDLVSDVSRMGIDTDVDLFMGSDHVRLKGLGYLAINCFLGQIGI